MALRAVAAIVLGVVFGIGFWVVQVVVLDGLCAVPILSRLWCTYGPGPLGHVEPEIGLLDFVGLPIYAVVSVAIFWKTLVRGESD
jgi:hypothetical protein